MRLPKTRYPLPCGIANNGTSQIWRTAGRPQIPQIHKGIRRVPSCPDLHGSFGFGAALMQDESILIK
jgi:hypothetical protein